MKIYGHKLLRWPALVIKVLFRCVSLRGQTIKSLDAGALISRTLTDVPDKQLRCIVEHRHQGIVDAHENVLFWPGSNQALCNKRPQIIRMRLQTFIIARSYPFATFDVVIVLSKA